MNSLEVFCVRLIKLVAKLLLRTVHLQREVEHLKQHNNDLRNSLRKLWQVTEALGDDNRLFTHSEIEHVPNQKEAIDHYFSNGGPSDFARRATFKKCVRRHMKRLGRKHD